LQYLEITKYALVWQISIFIDQQAGSVLEVEGCGAMHRGSGAKIQKSAMSTILERALGEDSGDVCISEFPARLLGSPDD